MSAHQKAEIDPIPIEYRFTFAPISQDCEDKAKTAVELFNRKWVAHLFVPAKTVLVKSGDERAEKEKEYLAPVGSQMVFLEQRQLTGQFATLFINCDKKLAYVLARGGVVDAQTWYGPFKF